MATYQESGNKSSFLPGGQGGQLSDDGGAPEGGGRLDERGAGEAAGRREAPHGSAAEGGDQRDYEAEAREMGWVPQEQFHDDPEKWVDAKDFVERGEHILPILRANNKKLRKELLDKEGEMGKLRESVASQGKIVKTLQKHYKDSLEAETKRIREQLRQELKDAKLSGDVDRELEVQDKLAELRNGPVHSSDDAIDAVAEEVKDSGQKLDPVFVQWNKDNPWFGDMSNKENRRRTEDIIRVGEDLRESGETSTGVSFMNKCLAEMERRTGSRVPSKVESGNRGTGRPTGGRAYDRLSKEAKDACMEDVDMFVGPGKMFKEVRAWQDHFANIYNEE